VSTEHGRLVACSNNHSIVPVPLTENGIQRDAAISTLPATAVPTAATVTPFDPMRTLVPVTFLGMGLVATIAWTVLLGYGLVLAIAHML
jgi:hypothetical protein